MKNPIIENLESGFKKLPNFVFPHKLFLIISDYIGLFCGHFEVRLIFKPRNSHKYWVYLPVDLSVGNNSTSLIAALSVSSMVSLSIP